VMSQSIMAPNAEMRRTEEALAEMLPLLTQMQARTMMSTAVAGVALLTALTALILLLT